MATNPPQATLSKQQRRREKAERRKSLEPLKQKIRQLEKEIAIQNATLSKIDIDLASPQIFEAHPTKGENLSQTRGKTQKTIAQLEEKWLALSAEYEA